MMCGLNGQLFFDGREVDRSSLMRMLISTEHRGRDEANCFIKKEVGLAHNRLAILDLSAAGSQPMFTPDNRYAILFNGEIFNSNSLKKRFLSNKSCDFRGTSDTEILLTLWSFFQEKTLSLIDGMFAFSVVDFEKRILWLARDRVGIKPLYYAKNNNYLIFSSEIKALFASGLLTPQINMEAMSDYFFMQSYMPTETLFKDVKSVAAGTFLRFDFSGNCTEASYWDFSLEQDFSLQYEDVIEELCDRIHQSVTSWCWSDVQIAAYVSGGLDSSTVASVAARSQINPLTTITSTFSGFQMKDESSLSSAVANQIRSEHHQVVLNAQEICKDHEDLMYVLDMPCAGFSAPYRTLSRFTRKKAKVVLTGHGGDELFMGYPRHYAAYIAQQLTDAYDGKRRKIDVSGLRHIGGHEAQFRNLVHQFLFKDERSSIHQMMDRSGLLNAHLSPDIQAMLKGYSTVDKLLKFIGNVDGFLNKVIYLDRKILLPSLLHVEDRTSMVENLESRTPLLALPILEFLPKIPVDFYFKNGLKSLIRDAAKKYLPKAVTECRFKSGVMYPVHEIFFEQCRDLVRSDLEYLSKAGLFRQDVNQIFPSLFLKEEGLNRSAWGLWSFSSWAKQFCIKV